MYVIPGSCVDSLRHLFCKICTFAWAGPWWLEFSVFLICLIPGWRRHWVVIISALCQPNSGKPSVPWWSLFCLFCVFQSWSSWPSMPWGCTLWLHLCGSREIIHQLKLGVIVCLLLWRCFRACRHMTLHWCSFFGWNLLGDKIKSPWHGL